jgi:putative tricarboxylic transport membrane protein
MFVVLGLAIIVQWMREQWPVPLLPAPFDVPAVSWVGTGLIINLIAIEYVGFILASAALFLCAARGFGSAHPMRDGILGFVLALTAYVGFDRVLGYQIGGGWVESLL